MARPKELTWGEALAYTLKYDDRWRNGGGRETAILYSGYFTEMHGTSFKLKRVTKRLISEDCFELQNKGKKNGTINRYISAVSKVLRYTHEVGLWEGDLPMPFKRYKENQDATERHHYSHSQVKEMVRHCREDLDREDLADIILFAALTGIRQDKILKMQSDRIRFDDGLINVIKTKNGEWRTIPIHDELKPILVRRCTEGKSLFGKDWNNADQLRHQFRRVIHNFMGLPQDSGWTFHGLRHSFGTWMVAAGVPIREGMELMGHKSINTTLRYCKSTDQGRRSAIDSLGFSCA